ncbi:MULTISPECIES: hypothetical protein [unclassified Endozoicomonas]|uniref:hypothetical protein n=1 Tax=unclassified Endozoicomonas TaxID=2644528 RepID=UPI002147A989|nr:MULTISPECIES: hypothetical protein [unclassified Endozoicomonas]
MKISRYNPCNIDIETICMIISHNHYLSSLFPVRTCDWKTAIVNYPASVNTLSYNLHRTFW